MNYRMSWCEVFLMMMLLFSDSSILAQEISFEQFTEKDGLPSMTTYEIIQDSSGLLWFGTENGLVSYDGIEFETHLFPELKDNDILELFLLDGKDIGFENYSRELCLMVGDSLMVEKENKSFGSSEIFEVEGVNYRHAKIFEKKARKFIFETLRQDTSSLVFDFCLFSESIQNEKITDSVFISLTDVILLPYMNYNDPSAKWIMNSKSIFLNNEYSEMFDLFEMEKQDFESNGYQAVKNKDNYYLIDKDRCYFDIDSTFAKTIDDRMIIHFTIIDDEYWFSDAGVLKRYSEKNKKVTTVSSAHYYHYFYFDNENVLWASTPNSGLIKFNNLNLGLVDVNSGGKVLNVATNGETLVVVGEKDICLLDKNHHVLNCRDNIFLKKGTFFIHSNGYYIGSGNTVIEISNNEFKTIKKYCVGFIRSLFQIEDSIYVGTHLGLGRFHESENKQNAKDLLRPKHFKKDGFVDMKYDYNKGSFIVATAKGLRNFDFKSEPQPIYQELDKYSINEILLSSNEEIYVSTNNNGIFLLTEDKVQFSYNKKTGLQSNNINDIILDEEYLYAATNNGLSRINLLNNDIKTINKYNGLSSSNVSHVEIFNDNLIVNVEGKLNIVDESEFEKNPSRSKIFVDEFYNNNEKVDYENNISFAYDQNKIEIYLKYISLRSGKDKRIEYQIPKVDTSWISTTEPIIRLPSLQPGKYQVKAKGVNALGEKSMPINISFVVNPPWWQTFWARALGLIGGIGLVSLVFKYRNRQEIKKEKIKREYLTQINEIKEQALQLQMNPHFIFNSLNAIQNFIGTDDEQNAMNYLARFARMIRLIFEYSKGTKISLEEEIEFIKLYLNLEKLRFQDKVDIHLNIDKNEVDNFDIIMIPPLLIQPIVENSFKHGLFHKKGKGHLEIDYKIDGNKIIVTVEDDGIGREASSKVPNKEKDYKTSSGISTTKERLGLLNYYKKGQPNTIFVEDLKNKRGNAIGTKTTITLSIL